MYIILMRNLYFEIPYFKANIYQKLVKTNITFYFSFRYISLKLKYM